MNDTQWADLVDLIQNGEVIPIVGPELLVVESDDGSRTSLEASIATAFARELGVAVPPDQARVRNVANNYLAAADRDRADRRRRLRPKLKSVVSRLKQCPPAFEQLAGITGFKMFVSVTPDTLLEDAVLRERFGGRHDATIITNGLTIGPKDLAGDLRELKTPVVFYPFGRVVDTDFAVTDEDMLEFLFELLSRTAQFENLFEALRRSHLLFLGCNFPDWLTRFWIRALTGKRLQSSRDLLEVIADCCVEHDESLVLFLKRTEIRVFHEGGAEGFVARLAEEWKKRVGAQPAAPMATSRTERCQVFISYSMTTDRAAAARIDARLRQFGLQTWFDADAIETGRVTTDELRRNIEGAAAFVPVLSSKAAARDMGHYRDEWRTAIEHARKFSEELPFIHPVVVDDVAHNTPGIPHEFWARVYERADHGEISDHFAEGIRSIVRRAQL